MTSVCVAVIGRSNEPLYLRAFDANGQNALRFHYIVHASLDIIDEILAAPAAKGGAEQYLGFLCPAEGFKVYGYATCTKAKFVAVVDDAAGTLRDNDIRAFFRKLHALYADAVCDPFYHPGDTITSKRFDSGVRALALTPANALSI